MAKAMPLRQTIHCREAARSMRPIRGGFAMSDLSIPIGMRRFQEAMRRQESLLAPLERPCLRWLAERLPERVGPDHLTLLGFAALFMAGLSYAAAARWPPALLLVDVWLAVNWFGDSLDGT